MTAEHVDVADIAARVRDVRSAIDASAQAAGRDPNSITLVAASKAQPAAALRAAYDAGVRDFGENYANELKAKRDALADLGDVGWHFIGRVQRGNARVIATCDLVHGVGSIDQAQALAKEATKAGRRLPVLLQINVAGEDTKNGFGADDVAAAIAQVRALGALEPRGFMAMPLVDDDAALDAAFAVVVALRARLAPTWAVLSMGMSSDFERAIAHGATHVRVGTRLFGARPSPAPGGAQ